MNLLLKNGHIVTADKVTNGDILIKNGKISEIGKGISPETSKVDVIDLDGQYIFPGFIDMHVHLREPGEEEKESLASGLSAAVHGGITGVCSMPNTQPAIDNEFLVKFLVDKAWEINKAKLYPIGSITKNLEGKELSEMASMLKVGAVAFTDDGSPVTDMLVLRRALQYIKPYDVPLILHCENKDLSNGGVMNEGTLSTMLGLPGHHRAAEEAHIAESIEVAKYFGRIHIAHVSTKGSVDIIRFAKQRGINVTAETAPHYFTLTEDKVDGYNTAAKMNPPLRTEEDRRAIIEGLRDGTIDVIATDHAPHGIDDKNKEFGIASFGITGLETAVMLTIQKLVIEEKFPLELIAKVWSKNPSDILKLKSGNIQKGSVADLTVISLDKKWTVRENMFYSKSKNTPFINLKGQGKAIKTIINGKIIWQENL